MLTLKTLTNQLEFSLTIGGSGNVLSPEVASYYFDITDSLCTYEDTIELTDKDDSALTGNLNAMVTIDDDGKISIDES